jgi:PTS system, IIA component
MLQQLIEVLQDKDIMERILSMDENTSNSEIKEVLALKNIK